MATKLSKSVTREVVLKDINGCAGDVAVTMSESGITFFKGRRKLSTVAWADIAKLTVLPGNAPAKFGGNHLGWLIELTKGDE